MSRNILAILKGRPVGLSSKRWLIATFVCAVFLPSLWSAPWEGVNSKRTGVIGFIFSAGSDFLTGLDFSSRLHAAEDNAIVRRQQEQQRARTMASRLIDTILLIQERQLEENGLQELQLYRDIRTMRRNLNKLIDTEMREVVDKLVEAQQVTGAAREAKLLDARKLVRVVVIRLSVERQNLLRRLKTAEISEQVSRLVQLETAAMTRTRSLPRQTRAEREKLALRVAEDQRLVNRLYLQLSEMLAEVSTWSGPLAAGAADGARILEAAGVKTHLLSAAERLELKGIENVEGQLASYASAAEHQGKAIAGLMQLLRIIERTQGIVSSERQAAADRLRAVEQKQRQLQKEVEKTELKVPPSEEMVKKQIEIRRDIAGLSDLLKKIPEAERHLDPAVKAASQAISNLFTAKKNETLLEQSKVLAHLKGAQEALANASDAENVDKSAAEYARQVKSLEAAKKALTEARSSQEDVAAKSRENPVEAQKPAAETAKKLAEAASQSDLPQDVRTRIAEAERNVGDEQKELTQEPTRPSDRKQEAVKKASKGVERARAEIEAALAEAKRREAAVKIGELVRAAEALERASATERDIAEKAKTAAESKGLEAADTKELKRLQEQVVDVARRIAEGVQETAPKGAKKVAESLKAADGAARQLADAEKKPAAATKTAAADIAKKADEAAKQLADAAREIRSEVKKTADDLVRMSDEQLKEVAKAQDAVNQIAQAKPESAVDRLKKLDEARSKIRQAQTEQLKAEGKPNAAAARAVSEKTAQAMRKQEAADEAAKQLAEGKSHTQLEATSKQQESADVLKNLADEAAKRPAALDAMKEGKSDPLVEALKKAGKKASEAAKETLDGNTAKAHAARNESRQALQQARKIADDEAMARAEEKPTNKPDARIQQQVSDAIAEAKQLAEQVGGVPAAAPLKEAAEASDKAVRTLSKPDQEKSDAATSQAKKENLEKHQKEVAKALVKAEKELAQAMRQLARQEAREIAKKGEDAGKIADTTADVDPGATAALRRAEGAAKEGAEELDPAGAGKDDAKQLASASKPDEKSANADMTGKQSPPTGKPEVKSSDSPNPAEKTAVATTAKSDGSPDGKMRSGEKETTPKPASGKSTENKSSTDMKSNGKTPNEKPGDNPKPAVTGKPMPGSKPEAEKPQAAKSSADQGMKSDPGDAAARVEASTKHPAEKGGEKKGADPTASKSEQESGKLTENAPQKAEAANDAVRQNIDRAAASLAAREQQIRKDREIARAIGTLAKIQQEAADTIAKERDELKTLAENRVSKQNDGDKPAMGEKSAKNADGKSAADSKSSPSESPAGKSKANGQGNRKTGGGDKAVETASKDKSGSSSAKDMAAARPKALSSKEKTAAQALRRATQQFAAAQRATGQGAVEISGQEQVANRPIRGALELASQLPVGDLPADEMAEGEAEATKAETATKSQTADTAEVKGQGKPDGIAGTKSGAVVTPAGKTGEATNKKSGEKGTTAGKTGADSQGGTPRKSAAGQAQQGRGEGQSPRRKTNKGETQLGTGFVSRSPDATARAMAGREGRNALAHPEIAGLENGPKVIDPTKEGLLSDTQDSQEGSEEGSPNSQTSQSGKPGETDGKNSDKQASEKGRRDTNPTSASAGQDKAGKGSNAADPRFSGKNKPDEAWFAKLPADLRKALRANADRRAPRAYEERLRRYLESVE